MYYPYFSWGLTCKKFHLQCRRPGFDPWVGKVPWRRERLPTPVFWPGEFHGLYGPWGHKELDMTEWLTLSLSPLNGFPGGTVVKNPLANAGDTRDLALIPGLGRSPGEGKGYPLQYSGLENSMGYSPWGGKESDMTEWLSLHFTYLEDHHWEGRRIVALVSGSLVSRAIIPIANPSHLF